MSSVTTPARLPGGEGGEGRGEIHENGGFVNQNNTAVAMDRIAIDRC